MRSRIGPAAVLVATLLALSTTACGPDNADTDTKSKSPASPTASEAQPTNPKTTAPGRGDATNGFDTEGDVDNSDFNYVCSRITASEVSAALGQKFKAIPESKDMNLPEGMAHCTYKHEADASKWFTIDYLGDAGWSNHQGYADRGESGYSHQPDGSIIARGPLGTAYVMQTANRMMMNVTEFGVGKLVGDGKFDKFRKGLPAQIG